MSDTGLNQIVNPSQYFSQRPQGPIEGGAVTCTLEGKRPIIAEIQSLVTPPDHERGAKANTTGVDYNRLTLLLAVLEKQLNLNLHQSEIYVNVVGGFTIEETAADLGIIASILSSYYNNSLKDSDAFIGEVGLSGEARTVRKLNKRIQELSKLGYDRIYAPENLAEIEADLKVIVIRSLKMLKTELGLHD